jgi:hypothetical protein
MNELLYFTAIYGLDGSATVAELLDNVTAEALDLPSGSPAMERRRVFAEAMYAALDGDDPSLVTIDDFACVSAS